jgi:phospholipid transport system substrate-binding protein
MTQFRLRFLLLALASLLTYSGWASASPETDAERFVRERQDQLFDLIRQKANNKIEQVFDEMLDYGALAQDTLRDYWNERSPKERRQFQCVLRGLVTDAHRKSLDKTVNYEVKFQSTNKVEGGYLVTTEAKNTKNSREEPVTIAYLVHRKDESWRVRDILTEGSSLVDNYRSQFRRIIKKDGFGELMRRMKNKLGKAADKC